MCERCKRRSIAEGDGRGGQRVVLYCTVRRIIDAVTIVGVDERLPVERLWTAVECL